MIENQKTRTVTQYLSYAVVQNFNDFLNKREREKERENENNHDFCAKQNEKLLMC